MENEKIVVFGIGSNTNDRESKIRDAIEELRTLLPDMQVSYTFNTASYNGIGSEYMNVVALATTKLQQERLHTFVKAFEWQIGRDQNHESEGLVDIDIDIVCYNGEVIKPQDYNQPEFQQALSSLTKQ